MWYTLSLSLSLGVTLNSHSQCSLPGFVNCPGTDAMGWGIGGDTAAILLGLKLYNYFPFLHRYITLIAGSHRLISQAGWNRCNLSLKSSVDNAHTGSHQLISQAGWNRCNLLLVLFSASISGFLRPMWLFYPNAVQMASSSCNEEDCIATIGRQNKLVMSLQPQWH